MAPKTTRLVALIGPMTGERHIVQTANHPIHPDAMLPPADVVLIVSDDVGSAMMFRYTAYGEMSGDTLHEGIAQAKDAAEAEYEDALMPWEEVPDDVPDAHLFAVRYAHDRLNDRDGASGDH